MFATTESTPAFDTAAAFVPVPVHAARLPDLPALLLPTGCRA